MKQVGVVIDDRYTRHSAGRNHPERPGRIEALLNLLGRPEYGRLTRVAPRMASEAELKLNHAISHIRDIADTASRPHTFIDADTRACAETWETACLAAGGVLALLDRIVAGDIERGFAMVRPPGHHAEREKAMGFCFFNNVAIAAQYLRRVHGVGRVMIVDWDVHHGNGTEHALYTERDILYVSLHQSPHYPGTGAAEDVGALGAEGFNVNIPLPEGCGDAEYLAAFERIIEPIAWEFDPGFVLISAGMDCHVRDPLGGMRVTGDGFAAMTRSLLRIATRYADGRCAAVLEGGYDLEGLTEGTARTLDEMMTDDPASDTDRGTRDIPAIQNVREIQSRYWSL